MSEPDPREIAAAVGRLTGQDEVSQDVLSGRLTAVEVVPLLAGILGGAIRTLFVPIVGAIGFEEGVNRETRAYRAMIRVADGSKLQVTIEAVE